MLKGVFNFGGQDRKRSNMKVIESKQDIPTGKLRYCHGGNPLGRSMSSLLDAGFAGATNILGTEDHMF